MGQVWAARLRGTRGFSKLVAIKTILPSDEDEKQLESMLLSEAGLASRIKHPNVVEGLDLGEHEGTLFFVMEWVSGEPLDLLAKTAQAKGGLPLPIAVGVVIQACRGLFAAHEAHDDEGRPLGIVHRDISPQNLLVSYAGIVKLTDFGVAKATQRMAQPSMVGQVKGKFAYMAPEQVRGAPLDRRTDIFAMGIVLYRITTGKHPFKGQTPAETIARVLSPEPPPRPSTQVSDYPPELDDVVMKALAHDREARFSSAREMQMALEKSIGPQIRDGDERDIESFMYRLCGPRLADRAHALQSAVELADAVARGDSPSPTNLLLGPRSYSTMRAVTIAVADGDPSGERSDEASSGISFASRSATHRSVISSTIETLAPPPMSPEEGEKVATEADEDGSGFPLARRELLRRTGQTPNGRRIGRYGAIGAVLSMAGLALFGYTHFSVPSPRAGLATSASTPPLSERAPMVDLSTEPPTDTAPARRIAPATESTAPPAIASAAAPASAPPAAASAASPVRAAPHPIGHAPLVSPPMPSPAPASSAPPAARSADWDPLRARK
jgi:serine/threonine-protein kinase